VGPSRFRGGNKIETFKDKKRREFSAKEDEFNSIGKPDVSDPLTTDAQMAELYTVSMTPQTDDPATPAFNFRSVFLGCIWGIFLACCDTLSFRSNAFSVTTCLAQLLSYPMGIYLAYIIPRRLPTLNPGPFTVKEHVIVYTIAGRAGGLPYGVDNVIGNSFW
jgi:OPT oligopeptide transporter protein